MGPSAGAPGVTPGTFGVAGAQDGQVPSRSGRMSLADLTSRVITS